MALFHVRAGQPDLLRARLSPHVDQPWPRLARRLAIRRVQGRSDAGRAQFHDAARGRDRCDIHRERHVEQSGRPRRRGQVRLALQRPAPGNPRARGAVKAKETDRLKAPAPPGLLLILMTSFTASVRWTSGMLDVAGLPEEGRLMKVRPGDKVLCNACNRSEACVGLIENFNDWYGKTVVTVYFDNPKWDHCDREVYYLGDLTPVRLQDGVVLTATPLTH